MGPNRNQRWKGPVKTSQSLAPSCHRGLYPLVTLQRRAPTGRVPGRPVSACDASHRWAQVLKVKTQGSRRTSETVRNPQEPSAGQRGDAGTRKCHFWPPEPPTLASKPVFPRHSLPAEVTPRGLAKTEQHAAAEHEAKEASSDGYLKRTRKKLGHPAVP